MTLSPVGLEVLKFVFGVVLLYFGWVFGQRILANWDVRKKRTELNIATARQFHELIGEFKELWRLWKMAKYTGADKFVRLDDDLRLEILKRATAAEGKVEAVILTVVSERKLEPGDIRTLGLFRQSYQQLRQAVRNGTPLDWRHNDAPYILFNVTACQVARMIDTIPTQTDEFTFTPTDDRPAAAEAARAFMDVIRVRENDWEIATTEQDYRVGGKYFPAPATDPARTDGATPTPAATRAG